MSKVKVFIVDDSQFFTAFTKKGLSEYPWINVVGTASDPYDAKDKIVAVEPDILIMDVEMPNMNGIEFLKILMEQWPVPTIVVSSRSSFAAEAKRVGAVDFVLKPAAGSGPGASNEFTAALSKIIKRFGSVTNVGAPAPPPPRADTSREPGVYKFKGVIALGASTGGTQSTAKILQQLPADMPGMVIVQHMPPTFTHMYAENLNSSCKMEIREAKNGDAVKPGLVLIAPGDFQMELVGGRGNYSVRCYKGEKVSSHCPSVDVLFNSVAKTAGKDAVGVILTGMGADGAKGLLEMRRKGAFTIGQDEKTSIVYGMPMEAYNLGAVMRQLPLENIAQALIRYASDMR